MKYDRELVGTTIRVMQKLKDVQKKREEAYYLNRWGGSHEGWWTGTGTGALSVVDTGVTYCLMSPLCCRMKEAKLREKAAIQLEIKDSIELLAPAAADREKALSNVLAKVRERQAASAGGTLSSSTPAMDTS